LASKGLKREVQLESMTDGFFSTTLVNLFAIEPMFFKMICAHSTQNRLQLELWVSSDVIKQLNKCNISEKNKRKLGGSTCKKSFFNICHK